MTDQDRKEVFTYLDNTFDAETAAKLKTRFDRAKANAVEARKLKARLRELEDERAQDAYTAALDSAQKIARARFYVRARVDDPDLLAAVRPAWLVDFENLQSSRWGGTAWEIVAPSVIVAQCGGNPACCSGYAGTAGLRAF